MLGTSFENLNKWAYQTQLSILILTGSRES